ncbi:MAG: hypothetical protein ACLR4Z_00965 [Butyricicoccaceae bacterium]
MLFETWDELTVPRWALVSRGGGKHVSLGARTAFHGGTARFICSASCRGYRRFSCRPHASSRVSRHGFRTRRTLESLHDGSAQLLNTAPDFVDEKAAALSARCSSRRRPLRRGAPSPRAQAAMLGGFWIALGLADGCFSPLGAALMLAGMLALYVSDISLHLTRAAWRTLGILLALLAAASHSLPDMDMEGIRGPAREGAVRPA